MPNACRRVTTQLTQRLRIGIRRHHEPRPATRPHHRHHPLAVAEDHSERRHLRLPKPVERRLHRGPPVIDAGSAPALRRRRLSYVQRCVKRSAHDPICAVSVICFAGPQISSSQRKLPLLWLVNRLRICRIRIGELSAFVMLSCKLYVTICNVFNVIVVTFERKSGPDLLGAV